MIISRCIIIILPSIYIYMILSFVKQYNLLYLNEIYIYINILLLLVIQKIIIASSITNMKKYNLQ